MLKPAHFDQYGRLIPTLVLLDFNTKETALFSMYESLESEATANNLLEACLKHGFTKLEYRRARTTSGVSKDRKCVINFDYDGNMAGVAMLCVDSYRGKAAIQALIESYKRPKVVKDMVNFICRNKEGLYLLQKPVNKAGLEIPRDNYAFTYPYDKLIQQVSSEGSGLILFNGIPGTGKSYFIRHLIKVSKQKFVYIPVDAAEILSDPSFLPFAMEKLENTIMIIEDAETILVDRQKARNGAAAAILNITDGILGEVLGVKILATVNIKENIDSALLRKGRMLAQVNFDKLSVDQANAVLSRLGSDKTVTEPTPLGELYNTADNGSKVETRPIGFNA